MAYTITTTNGTTIGSIADGTVDNTVTSLTLIGKNYAGYGIFLNENFVELLENFSNGIAPANPLNGQLWFDSTNRVIKLYDSVSTTWKALAATMTSSVQPPSPITGDLWWDTVNNQLKAYSGTIWVVVGPTYTASSGLNGAIVETVIDVSGASHAIIKFYVQSLVIAIVSKDLAFTPQTSISGYTTINPGITLISSSTVVGAAFNGQVTNSLAVGGIIASQLLRSDVSGVINGTLSINNNNGLTIGGSNNFNISVNPSTSIVNFTNTVTNADVDFFVAPSGVNTRALVLSGTTGQVILPVALVSTSTSTGALVVTGGVGIGGALNIGGLTTINIGVDSTSTTTGALVVTGGIGVSGNITARTLYAPNIFGNIVGSTGNLTTITSQSINCGNIYAGFIYGTILGNLATTVTSVGTLANLNVTGPVQFGGQIFANAGISSTTTTTGTITVIGGVGVTGNINAGGNIAGGNITTTGLYAKTIQSTSSPANIGSPTTGFNYLYVNNILPMSSNVGNIGSPTTYFNTVYATATTALYADLAERFFADAEYAAGTVVEIGGINEITVSTTDLSDSVLGVISTNPAYTMNNAAGGNDTHPVVALIGRVPVKAVGLINKGDRLVSAGNGCARTGLASEITPFNVIGRALVAKTSVEEQLILAIVKAIS